MVIASWDAREACGANENYVLAREELAKWENVIGEIKKEDARK